MTMTRDEFGIGHWVSKRFKRDVENICPLDRYWDDKDPKIRQVIDIWGDLNWIVGWSDAIGLPCPMNNMLDHVGGYFLVIRVRDGSLHGLHPKAIAL